MLKRLSLITLFTLVINNNSFAQSDSIETAILAGGCFWCIEADYEKLHGVIDVVSGYSGGKLKDPDYKQVSSGNSGHIEVVQIYFDKNIISYNEILHFFWRHIDPTRNDGQFCDQGPQYRPAIFYANDAQKIIAKTSISKTKKEKPFSEPLKVELIVATKFYPAEDYHQDYYKKNPIAINFIATAVAVMRESKLYGVKRLNNQKYKTKLFFLNSFELSGKIL